MKARSRTSIRMFMPRSSHKRSQFRYLPLVALVFALLVCVVGAFASSFVLKWGTNGNGDSQFETPRGIAVDAAGNVYVADSNATNPGVIRKFDANGNFLSRFGSNLEVPGGFIQAFRITVDSAGNIYVTDAFSERTHNFVQKFNSSGVFQLGFGGQGSGNGQFFGAAGVAVDSSGNIFVADPGNHRIQKFNSAGVFQTAIGSSGTGDGHFSGPEGVAIDADNNLYVADSGNNRIQVFTAAGAFVTKWGTPGTGNGQFNFPTGISVDNATPRHVYVADETNDRVQIFSTAGTFIEAIGTTGTGDGQFSAPKDVASNAAGTFFYVVDRGNFRIQKFGTAVTSPTANAGTDQTVECGGGTTSVTLDGSASTPGSGTINSYSWAEGPTSLGTGATLSVGLGLGVHTITLTVTDTGGGTDTDDVVITVQDTLAPDISCPANVIVNLPMNSTATSMVVNYTDPTATDGCSSTVTVNSTPASGSVFPVGSTTVNATADDGNGHTSNCSFNVSVQYNFAGFFPPVANLPALNVVQAGRAIPVKFSLSGDKGLGIFAAGSPSSGPIVCNSSDPATSLEETVNAGGSSLTYNPLTDQYNYVWKTDAGWAGTCRQLVLQLNDGTIHRANFKFR
jgi:hypothetical protein